MNHIKLLLKSLDISIYIRYLNVLASNYYSRGHAHRWSTVRHLLNELIISIIDISEGLVDVSGCYLWIKQRVNWRQTTHQEVLLWVGHQIHCYFIHINIEVSLEPHGTRHIIYYICYYWILFFKMILLLLYVGCLYYWWAIFNLIFYSFILSEPFLALLLLLILVIHFLHDVEQCLVINRKNAVRAINEHVLG